MLYFDYMSQKYIDNIGQFKFKSTPDELSVELFLKEKSLNLHDTQTAITRLYFDDDQKLIGFFTLHNDLISLQPHQIKEFQDRYGWRLATDDQYSYPAIKLHYLGVDSDHRDMGYGKHMIGEVIEIASEVSEQSGCNFVSVEALNSSIEFYRKRGFKWVAQTPEFANMIFKLGEVEASEEEPIQLDPVTLGKMVEILTTKREILGWDHSKLAQVAGVDESDIESFEFSAALQDLGFIKQIAVALEVSYSSLFKK